MNTLPVIAIVGPTAVGKTAFAVKLAQRLVSPRSRLTIKGVDLISADSRQVYQGIEIVSGADLGEEWVRQPDFFQHSRWPINLYGVSYLKPDQEWSVAHFQHFAQQRIQASVTQQRLPMLVGGTGLYFKYLQTEDAQLHVPPNPEVRRQAESLSVSELQAWISRINPAKWTAMNASDRANPRRLVRALEIAMAGEKLRATPQVAATVVTGVVQPDSYDVKIVGLEADFAEIESKIKKRILERLDKGARSEIEALLSIYSQAENRRWPVFSATGLKLLMAYHFDQLSKDELCQLWYRQERQYAKRQLTWWKKQSGVHWFDVTSSTWPVAAYTLIESWLAE